MTDKQQPGETLTHVPQMTLRDWFASQALQGWLSGPCQGDELDDVVDEPRVFVEHQSAVAKACYGYADAMLAERAKGARS